MRNLKRVLSLSLASIMLLGMMVIGSSAASNYTDVDYVNDNVEAIEVLQAINVMSGDLDNNGNLAGTFRPGDEVKRSEMARIMAFLMDLDYDYYVGVNPFADMVGHWAEKYAAACAANGIIYGRGANYDPDTTVTAVEAAAMLMRALGYFQNPAVDQPNGFEIDTVRQAGRIDLFDRVNVKTNEPMTRNDVAQLVLNALQSGMVEPSTNSRVEVTVGDAQVAIGSSNYVYVVARDRVLGSAINTDRADQGNGADGLTGPILDLGEKLYNGELKLSGERNNIVQSVSDVFGRPARMWEYKGEEIGTYAKTELLAADPYTAGVSGKTIYDLLGQNAIRDYGLEVYLNGADNTANLTRADLVRTNNATLSGTGRGVQTEVYLDTENAQITIVCINTYLAKANNDYNENTETISLTVYDSAGGTTKLVDVEDVPGIVDLVKDDWILVDWADESPLAVNKVVQNMYETEIMENVAVTGFASSTEDSSNYDDPDDPTRRVTDITVDGTTYKSNVTAYYKQNTLNNYSTDKLVDKTYTLYFDQFGYFIGAELYSGKAQYVFITGYDRPKSFIATSTAKASAIFTDGTMGAIEVNVLDSNKNIAPNGTPKTGYNIWSADNNHEEMWYSYTVRNNVYTLTPVAGWTRTFATNPDTVIDCSNVRLVPSDTPATDNFGITYNLTNGTGNSYGEDASIYITVKTDRVDDTAWGETTAMGITEVEGLYTGVQNVKLLYQPHDWVHAVYDTDNNYIVAAIVLGEAEGVVDNYAYIRGGAKNEKIVTDDKGDIIHYWDVEVIMNGELTTKTIKSRFTNTTGNLVPRTVQELIMDADGYVTTIRDLDNPLNNAGTEVADDSRTPVLVDKVYSNYDYLNNGITNVTGVNGGKPNSTDLANYSVYDINVSNSAFNAAAVVTEASHKGSFVRGGTTYYYSDLVLQGRTLHYTADQRDVGLTVMENAKGFIYHWVNNEWKYEDAGSVADAFRLLNDADNNGANNPTNGLQFSGRIVAVLNSTGRAEWVFFVDNTVPQVGAITGPGYSGTRVDPGRPVSYIQGLLNQGYDVIIEGDWDPSLGGTVSADIIIPAGQTLTIEGDVIIGGAGTHLRVGAEGTGSRRGKLNVTEDLTVTGTAGTTTITVPITVGGDANFTYANTSIRQDMSVTGGFNVTNSCTVDIASGATVRVTGTINLNSSGALNVNGSAYGGTLSGGVTKVLSSNSLHVTNVDTSTVVIIGDGTNASNNGYVEITGTLSGKLIAKNVSGAAAVSAAVKNASSTAEISINNNTSTVQISGTLSTDNIAMAEGSKLVLTSSASTSGDGNNLFVDENGIPVAITGGATVTAPAGGVNNGQLDTTANGNGSAITGGSTITVDTSSSGFEETSPFKAEIRIVRNANELSNAILDGFKATKNGAMSDLTDHGRATFPWLLVKVTTQAAVSTATDIVATVKLNNQTLGQLEKGVAATQKIDDWTDSANQSKTFAWEMSKSTNTNATADIWSLNNESGPKSGTYTVELTLYNSDGTTVSSYKKPESVSISYTVPSVIKEPTAYDGKLKTPTDVSNSVAAADLLPADGQSYSISGNTITVSKAYDMTTYGTKKFENKAIKADWFPSNDYTHFIIVEIQKPTDNPDGKLTHFKVKSPAGLSRAGTIGEGDPAYLIFGWNKNTGSSNAPATILFDIADADVSDVTRFANSWGIDVIFPSSY